MSPESQIEKSRFGQYEEIKGDINSSMPEGLSAHRLFQKPFSSRYEAFFKGICSPRDVK